MKKVACPICSNNILSESFIEGEKFRCPHCNNRLTVESCSDIPIIKSPEDFLEKMEWASNLWENNRFMLSDKKLKSLGEFVVGAMEMEQWPKESIPELSERIRNLEKKQAALSEYQLSDGFLSFQRILLDIYYNLRLNHDSSKN